jgi:hypothetical protein
VVTVNAVNNQREHRRHSSKNFLIARCRKNKKVAQKNYKEFDKDKRKNFSFNEKK